MDRYEVLEVCADGRQRVRFTSGPLTGRTVVTYPVAYAWVQPPLPPPLSRPVRHRPRRSPRPESPDARASRLLRSFLTPAQRADWVRHRRFMVPTRFGSLEFGQQHNIGFWPTGGGELRLCVVPTGTPLPNADVWTNLLLALKGDPQWFFTVANWRRPDQRSWNFGPVPGIGRRA